MNHAIRFVLLLAILVTSWTTTLRATTDSDSLLTPEKLWDMQRIGSPVISPDGRWVVSTVTRYTVADDKSHTDIWLFSSDGSVQRPLTRHGSADGSPVFSPDGTRLAFISRRDDDTAAQLYLLPINEPGEAVRLTTVPTGVGNPKWVGRHLYFTSSVMPGMSWDEMRTELDRRRASHVSALTWDALPYSSWDRYIDATRETHVYRIPADGGAVEPITLPTGFASGSYDVSPDESLVAFATDTHRDDLNTNFDIYLVRPGSAEARLITAENLGQDGAPLFSRDGTQLAYTRQRINGFYADTRRLVIYNVAAGTHREVTTNWDRSADGLVWAHDNSGLYGAIDDAATSRIWFIPVTGRNLTPRAVTGATNFGGISIARNGTLVALNESFSYPSRLVRLDPRTGAATRLDTLNNALLSAINLGTYESVSYKGADDQDIQMWIHYPPDFDPTKKYPLIFLIHGGPHNGISDAFSYRWNAQVFASWGYVVTWHNFHGSSGFGQDFADSINPDWRTKPLDDTQKGAAFMAAKPYIDAERIVAAGASYGGYLSSVLLGEEHPFKTLVIHAAVYNMYSQMSADFAVHTVRFGNFWDNPEIYRDISPHYNAGNFRTPALIIHGQTDLRVPVGQGFEIFRTLQSKGIDSRMVYYPDENHWILKPNNSIFWYQEVRSWIARYATPGGQ